MNPLYNVLNRSTQNRFGNMMQQFNHFKNSFTGDPKQKVQELLNSGRMSQQQFNQFQQMATEFMNAFK